MFGLTIHVVTTNEAGNVPTSRQKYKCWNAVLSCSRLFYPHHPLHLWIWKLGHKHVTWTWYDTQPVTHSNVNMSVVCRNFNCQHFNLVTGLDIFIVVDKLAPQVPNTVFWLGGCYWLFLVVSSKGKRGRSPKHLNWYQNISRFTAGKQVQMDHNSHTDWQKSLQNMTWHGQLMYRKR